MSEENNRTVVVRHHIITEEVRTIPKTKEEIENERERDKWCCTRIQEARQRNANNTSKCLSEVLCILLESCGVVVLFVFENLIGIVLLLLGIIFVKDCPYQPSLPISLMVFGVSSIIHGITIQFIRWKYIDIKKRKDGFATCAQVIIVISTLVHMIALFWAALTVFTAYGKVKTRPEDKDSEQYCHGFLYWFTFWFFVFMAILCLIFLMLLCCIICFVLSGGTQSPQQRIIILREDGGQQKAANPAPPQ